LLARGFAPLTPKEGSAGMSGTKASPTSRTGKAAPLRRASRLAKPLDLPEVIHLSGPAIIPPEPPEAEAKTPARKSRSGSDKRARSQVMFVRVTPAEHEEMETAARAEGFDELGTYARTRALAEPESRRGEAHVTTRPKSVPFRVTEEERAQITELADRAGLTPGSYVRLRALKRPVTLTTRRPPVEKAELRRLLGLLGLAGSNINQLARDYNSGREVPDDDARAAIADVQEAARAIIRSLGGRGE